MQDNRRPDPHRYVGRLLLWQGTAWLALAAAGLIIWLMALWGAVAAASGAEGLWRGGELVAIATGAALGTAEVSMACRLRGAPRLLLALGLGVQGVTLAAGLIAIGISVLVTVSTVTLVT
jgi:hypothetical protein